MSTDDTFNMVSTAELVARVDAGMIEGRAKYGDALRWITVIGDLSNMYTELDHSAVETAVSWESRLTGKRRVADRVSVHRRKRESHLGRAYSPDFVEIHTADILAVSAYDNRNMLMNIKGKVARQQHGCPMGSNTSPPKAVITCSPAEAEWNKQRNRLQMIAITCRYMDDVFVCIAYSCR